MKNMVHLWCALAGLELKNVNSQKCQLLLRNHNKHSHQWLTRSSLDLLKSSKNRRIPSVLESVLCENKYRLKYLFFRTRESILTD